MNRVEDKFNCDVCGTQIFDENTGQTTAHTVICSECLRQFSYMGPPPVDTDPCVLMVDPDRIAAFGEKPLTPVIEKRI